MEWSTLTFPHLPPQKFFSILLVSLASAIFICHYRGGGKEKEREKEKETKSQYSLTQAPDIYMIKFSFLFKV